MEAERYWKMTVTRGGCVMCAANPPSKELRHDRWADLACIDGHHIIGKQDLRHEGLLDEHEWDERNGVGLCRYHHARHEHWKERCPRELLPVIVFEFATELDAPRSDEHFGALLDREYPAQLAA